MIDPQKSYVCITLLHAMIKTQFKFLGAAMISVHCIISFCHSGSGDPPTTHGTLRKMKKSGVQAALYAWATSWV